MEHVIAAGQMGRQVQTHLVGQGIGSVDTFHLIQHLFTAFCPLDGFFAVELAQGADDILLMFDLLLLHVIRLLLDLAVDLLLLPVEGVVAVINVGFLVFDLNDLGDDAV